MVSDVKLHCPLWPFMVMLLMTAACTSGPQLDDRPYQAQVQKDRADKDAFFGTPRSERAQQFLSKILQH